MVLAPEHDGAQNNKFANLEEVWYTLYNINEREIQNEVNDQSS